jgi:hypothetical protein
MPNIKQTIDGHNKSTWSTISSTSSLDMCSCPKSNKELCPLSNKCISESVVYQATVTIKDNTSIIHPQTYVGLTEISFKTRLANHKSSFNSFDKRNATELSKYVWELKNRNIDYVINWKLYWNELSLITVLQIDVICVYGRNTLLFVSQKWPFKQTKWVACRHNKKIPFK